MTETDAAHVPNATRSPEAAAEKKPWHVPKLEEVDFTETQTGSGPYVSDFTTYGS